MEGHDELSSAFCNSDTEMDEKVSFNGPRSHLKLKLTITAEFCNMMNKALAREREKENRVMNNIVAQPVPTKFRAAKFSASSLTIGRLQLLSQREEDLVGKFHYNKKQVVWEILNGDRKRKIVIPFSNITAIKATIQDDESEELKIELERPPEFGEEAPPQPRKHTNWDNTKEKDFTQGEALIFRRHVVKCKPGALGKHYNKLLQRNCDLLEVSRRPFPTDENPELPEATKIKNDLFNNSRCNQGLSLSSQQQPNGSDESYAPQNSVAGFNPIDTNSVTGASNWSHISNIQENDIFLPQGQGVTSPTPNVAPSPNWNHISNIQEHDIFLPQGQGVTSPTPNVAPSPEPFEINNVESWTCQDNMGMSELELAVNMSNEVTPPIMVSSPSIVAQSSEHFETNTHPLLLDQPWLKSYQNSVEMKMLELVDGMSNEDTTPIKFRRYREEH